jgi:adenylosuccinate lyase
MPGRTHFQHAQPVLLSHHLLAHVWRPRATARLQEASITFSLRSRRARGKHSGPRPKSGCR